MKGYADVITEIEYVAGIFSPINTFFHGYRSELNGENIHYPLVFVDMGQSEGGVIDVNSLFLPTKLRYEIFVSVLDQRSETDSQTISKHQFRENIELMLYQLLAKIKSRAGNASGNLDLAVDLESASVTFFENTIADKAYEIQASVPFYVMAANCTEGTFT